MKVQFGDYLYGRLGSVALVLFLLAASLQAADVLSLDVADKSVLKTEARYSMMGPRSTLVFYIFPEQQAVLVVTVGNKTTKFPVSATLNVFDQGTTAEGLAKWINNQHSDALFADAPRPNLQHPVAAEHCETLSHKKLNRKENHDNYVVEFKIGEVKKDGVFELKAFTATTQVLVKAE